MTKIIAHAGCENTVANSKENIVTALNLGADIIEIDIRLHNGIPYLSHDLICKDHYSDYLTLHEAIEMIRSSQAEINCDLKEPEAFFSVIEILRDMKMESRTFFSGENFHFTTEYNPQFHKFLNVENLGIVSSDEILSPQNAALLIQYYSIHKNNVFAGYNINYQTLTDDVREQFQKANIPLVCWTVDDKKDIRTLIRAKVDYITTNLVKYAMTQRELF